MAFAATSVEVVTFEWMCGKIIEVEAGKVDGTKREVFSRPENSPCCSNLLHKYFIWALDENLRFNQVQLHSGELPHPRHGRSAPILLTFSALAEKIAETARVEDKLITPSLLDRQLSSTGKDGEREHSQQEKLLQINWKLNKDDRFGDF